MSQNGKSFVVLSDGSLAPVPEGADPDFIRRFENAKLEAAKKPKKKKRRSRRSSGSRYAGKSWRADSVLGRSSYFEQQAETYEATRELVDRANGNEEADEDEEIQVILEGRPW
jgi:hypothetical protein